MRKFLLKILSWINRNHITDRRGRAEISRSCDTIASDTRDMASQCPILHHEQSHSFVSEPCPFCGSENFVKRGTRKKKLEIVQLYLCRDCNRTFTAQSVKGKHYPLKVVIEGMSYHNLGFTLEDSCRLLSQKFGVNPGASTLGGWVTQYSGLCRYARIRPYAVKMCRPEETVEVTTMAHRQLYRFRYHRPKLNLIISEHYKHRRFEALKDYLDAVSSETPHQYFQDGLRISEIRSKFDKAQMIVKSKHNYANELARFCLQAVKENKQRHEELQRFMIANDSVTVATEVPVYIRKEDIEHMENQLNFKILDGVEIQVKGKKTKGDFMSKTGSMSGWGRLLTGHIDIIQVRNGMCHLLDYKPNAAKEKPIEQLTWYAMALSRLTGLRLYEFKCGWFDEKDYFEFYPLHVVKKISNRKRKKIYFKSGMTVKIPEENKIVVA